MKLKPYFYAEPDGVHFPDARAGADYLYGFDFSDFLKKEAGEFVSVVWTLESGLTGAEEFVTPESIAYMRIYSPYVGSFRVSVKMSYTALGVSQSITVPLIVKVL